MKDFNDLLAQYSWDQVQESILSKTTDDVHNALNKTERNLEDFKALISPVAKDFLEPIAQLSQQLTQKRFGKTIQMYIPLYVSNECQNICTYCGFSLDVKVNRKTLSDKELLDEANIIKTMGYDHVLLVSGEANLRVGRDYFRNAIRLLKPYFANIAMEVQPLDEEDYKILIDEGLHSVLVYQETYHKAHYKKYHPKGKKSNYNYRASTPDRLGRASIHKIGLGTLIGLEDWRTDAFFTALHLRYLEKTYWQTKYSVSFPRLRPCANEMENKHVISDRELVQLICAYRLLNEELELSMSTRESSDFRDNIIKMGVTSISADSKTEPYGYSNPKKALEQFEIDDKRSTTAFVKVMKKNGYAPVFKDWDWGLQ